MDHEHDDDSTPEPRTEDEPRSAPRADEPERVIITVRPAMFRAHPFKYLLIVAIFLLGLALGIGSQIEDRIPSWTLWVGIVICLFAAGWWIKWWIAAHLWIRVVISNKRTVRHEGIVRRHSTEVLHDHLRSVDINQNFIQRLTNVGYLGIDSSGQDGIEIEIRDIPGPYEIKAIIDRFRQM